jgi:hypothetical protein
MAGTTARAVADIGVALFARLQEPEEYWRPRCASGAPTDSLAKFVPDGLPSQIQGPSARIDLRPFR